MEFRGVLVAVALALLAVTAATLGPAVAAAPAAGSAADDDEIAGEPRAEAGLDQSVTRGAMVLLDATQSWSPNGELVSYEWEIESPSGGSVSPTCEIASCRLANFDAAELGTYTVELTVEDGAGMAKSDTMYVDVAPAGEFGVELLPPLDAPAGDVGNFTADVTRGNATLDRVEWYAETDHLGTVELGTQDGQFHQRARVDANTLYRVELYAADGRLAEDSWVLEATYDPGEWPRIEGPQLVTGERDDSNEDGEWLYEDLAFTVDGGPLPYDEEGIWSIEGADRANFSGEVGVTRTTTLTPGVYTVYADVDQDSVIPSLDHAEDDDGMAGIDMIRDPDRESSTGHNLEIDPPPEIDRLEFDPGQEELYIEVDASDRHGDLWKVEVSVEGYTLLEEHVEEKEEIEFTKTTSVPAPISGPTRVGVTVRDTRGQPATASKITAFPIDEDGLLTPFPFG